MSNKDEYFKKSVESGVAKRCPILNKCRRRSDTIALFNNIDIDGGISWAKLEEPYIPIKGEAPYKIAGNNNWMYGALCPEVPLFEPTISVLQFSGSPIIRGQYDKYMDPSFEILETGHYTECAEYSDYMESKQLLDKKLAETLSGKTQQTELWKWLVGTLIAIAAIVMSYIK
jgi:hypothetical protein